MSEAEMKWHRAEIWTLLIDGTPCGQITRTGKDEYTWTAWDISHYNYDFRDPEATALDKAPTLTDAMFALEGHVRRSDPQPRYRKKPEELGERSGHPMSNWPLTSSQEPLSPTGQGS